MSAASTRGRGHPLSWSLVIVALIAVVTYAPVVTYGFTYDDHWTVEHDAALGQSLAPLLRTLFGGHGVARGVPDATRPAMVASLWLDRRLFGSDPAGFHLHSLLLYAGVSVLAALAVFSITRRRTAAVVGGAVFAVAPVHAEVVAAINYREDLIAAVGVFGVVAWLFAPRRRGEAVDSAVLLSGLLLLSLFGKESAISVVPVVLAALVVHRDPRTFFTTRRTAFFCLCGAGFTWGVWRAWLRVAGRDDVPLSLVHRGATERVLRTGRYVVRVALDGLFPVGWSPDYATEPTPSALWLGAVLVLVGFVVMLSRRSRTRAVAAGVAIALVAGLATSPLVSPINERADRFAFLATLGGAVFWGAIGARVARAVPLRLRAPALALALLPFAFVARGAAAPWRSDRALWAVAVERAPASARAWTGLSQVLRASGDLDGADRAVEHAIMLEPTFLRARVTRVYNRLARGDVVRAREELEEIRRRGGARQQGMRRAAVCASGPPNAARACSGLSVAP
jgi:hypothetical protein